MKPISTLLLLIISMACFCSLATAASDAQNLMTASLQKKLTPDRALQRLMRGNKRFLNHQRLPVDLIKQAQLTANGQYPAAIVLSCIDSRVPPEIIFDQNVGNIFVTRVAANVLSDDVLGGIEFATRLAGAKLILVLGHDACGAVKGACQNAKLGHLTQLLAKIQPAIKQAATTLGKKDCNSETFINTATADNVRNVVKMIPQESSVINQLIKAGKVKVIGAMYHLDSGKVSLLAN